MAQQSRGSEMKGKDTFSLIDIFLVIVKRWKFIFFTTFSAAVLIFTYAYYTKTAPSDAPFNYLIDYYTSEALIRLQEEGSATSTIFSQGGLSALANFTSGTRSGNSSAALAIELLKGNTLLDQIAEEFDFKNTYNIASNSKTESRLKITSSMKILFDAKTGILSISYTDQDPELAMRILVKIVDLLELRFKNLTMEKILNKKIFLEERLDQVNEELKIAQNKLIDFQIKHKIVDVISSTDTTTDAISTEIIFSQYLPRSERHEITSNYFDLGRDRRILGKIYELLMQQYETVKIEEMDDTRTFQIIEYPEVPEVKSGPNRSKTGIIVTTTVLLFAILLSFIFEYIGKLWKDPEESKKLEEIKEALGFSKRSKRRNIQVKGA